MKKQRYIIPTPTKKALVLLLWELPTIAIYAAAILVSFLIDYKTDPLGAAHNYAEWFEYIGVSSLISVGSTILIDLTDRELRQK